jgi:hypothetical protein
MEFLRRMRQALVPVPLSEIKRLSQIYISERFRFIWYLYCNRGCKPVVGTFFSATKICSVGDGG